MIKRFYILLLAIVASVGMSWAAGIPCTAADLGKVLCTDGSIYATVSDATAANKTAVAMIAYIDTENNKGLALALVEEKGNANWSEAISKCAAKTPTVTGGTWKLASEDEWNKIIDAAGSRNALRDGFSAIGGSNLKSDGNDKYWSSTESSNTEKGRCINFSNTFGGWSDASKTTNYPFYARACLAFNIGEPEPAPAKLPGAFTINANGDKIVFSKGNLQAKTTDLGANWTWDFAPNQWSLIGNAVANNAINGNKKVSANGTVDLFGWSTAATYYGINESWKNDDYAGDFVDWGALMGTEWRTLSRDEWRYIIYDRTDAYKKRGQATVNGVPGYVLLPDAWTLPSGLSFTNSVENFTTNQYDGADWTAMESAGAVFLPAAGVREGTDIYQVNIYGWYWASTPNETDGGKAYYLYFDKSSQGVTEYNRWKSKSVRLVTEAPIPPYEAAIKLIDEIPDPVVLTAECKAKIDAARTAYNALSDGDKALVTNSVTLTTAETAFENVMNIWLSGDCDAILWKDTTLTIRKHAGEGNGAMADYTSYYGDNTAPWFHSRWYNPQPGDIIIKSVTIEEGVTHLGDNAFGWMIDLKTITIPSSVTSIGEDAFYWSKAVDDIYLSADPSNLTWVLPHSADNQFKPEKATRCHVPADLLTAYQEKFGTLNMTFVGDLDPITPLTPEQQQALDAAKDKIAAIPSPVVYTPACKDAIDAARAAYDALTPDMLKQLVSNYTTLTAAEATYANLKDVVVVEAKIAAIPQPVTLKLATRDSIESARAAYDALTADQKLLVSNYDVLTAAEATWAGLINVAPAGALSGKYTINDGGDVIYFAHGNLQYTRENLDADWSTGTFRLAENQYDRIELVKTYPDAYCTDNYGDKTAVGLFGWGTWGEGKTPNLTSSDRSLYTWSTDFSGTLEGTDTWRTLTKDEWVYLLAHNNQSYATVHGVNGLLVAPDGKDIDGKSMENWVEINDETWTTMQNDGYLFLPACGQRSQISGANITTGGQGEEVLYYSSTQYNDTYAHNIWYKPGQAPAADDFSNKRQAFGVRLVSAGVNPLDQVQVVKGLIDAIPVPVTLDDACVNAIQSARTAYDALSDDAKAILDAADVKKMTDAEQALKDLNQAEADEVIAKINNIPTPVELKLATRDSIESARAAYDALSEEAKALVPTAEYQKLLDAEDALAALNPGGGMPAGALSGKFTINEDGDQISFAKGNLQATTTDLGETWTWGFAANQWDLIGNAAANNAVSGNGTVSANGTVDLFGWSTPTTYYGIHNSKNNDYYSSDFREWGENITGAEWKTLSPNDWNYIIKNRADAAQKQGQAKVNGVNGYIFLPDEWELPTGLSFTAKPNNWTANVYEGEDWTAMENAGALFLPMSPWRSGNTVTTLTAAYYWTSDYNNSYMAMAYSFQEDASVKFTGINRYAGIPVRLVTADAGRPTPLDSAQAVKDLIDAIPTPVEFPTSGAAIAAALNAYDALSDAAKGALDAADVQKLTDAATQYAAQEAIAAIEAIPAEIVYDPAVKAAIETARDKYDALIDASKALVSAEVLHKLTNAEEAWAILVAKVEHNVSYIGKDGELKNEKVALLHIPEPAPDFNGYEFVRWDVKAGDFLEEGLRIKAVYTPIITTDPVAYDTLVYNGTAQTLITAGIAKEGHIEYRIGEGEWSTELPQAMNAGTYVVTYKLVRDGHDDYISPNQISVTIAKTQVAFDAPTAVETLVYTASNQTLIAAGQTNDGTFEYTLAPNDEESWNTALPQAKDAGTYSVYYRVQGDLNHLDSTAVDPIAVTIAKAELTATADNKAIIFGELAPQFTVTYAGWQGDDEASVLTGEIAYATPYVRGNNVGEYTITPSGVDAANYTITFVNGTLTVNRKSAESSDIMAAQEDDEQLVYTNAVNKPTIFVKDTTLTLTEEKDYTLTFVGRGETEYTESATAPTHVGEYTAIVAFVGNYKDTLTVDFTISKAELTITADDKENIFGEEAPEFTVSYEGFLGTDTKDVLTGSQAYACEYKRGDNIGDYTIIPSGVDAHDYVITFVNGTLTVNRKSAKDADIVAAQLAGEALVYNAEVNRPTIVVTDTTLTLTEDKDYVLTFIGTANDASVYEESAVAPTKAGDYTAIVAFVGNYIDTLTVDFTVSKAPLTITADDKEMIYGDEHPEFTVSYDGFLGTDDNSVLFGTQGYSCVYAPGSYIGTYAITPKDVEAYDYAITFVDGTLTVSKAAVYVSGAEVHIAKFEDNNTDAEVTDKGVLHGVKLNDPVDHITTASFSSADVAEHLTITLFYELSGDPALIENYYLTVPSEVYTEEGVIIEQMLPDNDHQPGETEQVEVKEGIDVYLFGYCDGSGNSLRYHLNRGIPDQYMIDFEDSRFTDVDWTNLDTPGKDGTIFLEIPEDMPTGDYNMSVQFRDSRFDWLESRQFNVTFHVNLPETYTMPQFGNVIALVDTCECFTDIQWYYRATDTDVWEPIPGATGYYCHVDNKLTGEYFVKAKMNGVETFTCPQTDMETLYQDDIKQAKVSAYPNPVVNTTTVTIENSENRNHNLRIVNMMGIEVENATFEGNETTVDMGGYTTGNYMISVDGIVVKVMKK